MSKMSKKAKLNLRTQLRKDLVMLLDGIWLSTEGLSSQELADKAGLHVSTVNRLYYGAFQFPRFETVQKLARVAGYDISLTESGIAVKSTYQGV